MRPSVLIVAPSAYTLGGLATWLDYLLPGLRRIGWNATLGLVSGPRHHRVERYLESHPDPQAVPIHCETGTHAGRVAAVRGQLRRDRPDIVLSVNIPDALVAAAEEGKRGGRPIHAVMTCHGIQSDLFADMAALSPVLDGVVCTNRLAQRLAAAVAGISADRSRYACYGTAEPKHDSARRLEHHPLAVRRPAFTLGYVGRIEQSQKRVHDLVAIVAHLTERGLDIRMLVAGDGPDEGELRQRIQRVQLEDRFVWLGVLSPKEVASQVYRVADALIVTSDWETGPIVIWEAMSHGCPVVTSRYVGSGHEAALESELNCLQFDIGDTDAAANQVERLTNSPELRAELISAGRELVHSRYSIGESIRQWDEVLRYFLELPCLSPASPRLSRSRKAGRLDDWFGPRAAERLRRLWPRPPIDAGPEGEWPHTLGEPGLEDTAFRRLAVELDQAVDECNRLQVPSRQIATC